MNVLSLFSGIGGFDAGLERAGHTVVGQVELDPFCQRVLAARWPGVERWDDVRQIATDPSERNRDQHRDDARTAGFLPPCDLLVGGFPCQDLSVAGKRAGLKGTRSSFFHEFVRIAKRLTPTWGIVENVPGLISSHRGRDLWVVLQGLRECFPAVGGRVLDSQHFGVAQRRRRLFIIGGPSEDGVAQVLALTASVGGHPAAGGETGTDLARCLAVGANGSRYDDDTETFVTGPLGGGPDGIGRRTEDDPNLVVTDAWMVARPGGDGGIQDPGVELQDLRRGFAIQDIRDLDKRQNGFGIASGETAYTVDTVATQGVATASAIRRLTPLECERLQGFPDGWTCTDLPLSAYAADPDAAALACRCPDSPRYRALGNAVTVPVITYLGRRFP